MRRIMRFCKGRYQGISDQAKIKIRPQRCTTYDVLLTVTCITTLDEVLELPLTEATVGVGQLEGPEELVGSLEVGASGVDLVNEVLDGDDAELAKGSLDDTVVSDGDALLVDLGVSALVDQFADRLEVSLAVGNVRLNKLEHLGGSLGQLDKDTVVDLEQAEELKDLAGLGGNVVDTAKTDDEDDLGLSGDVEFALGLRNTAKADLLALLGAVLLDVLLSTLEDDAALLLLGLEVGECKDERVRPLLFRPTHVLGHWTQSTSPIPCHIPTPSDAIEFQTRKMVNYRQHRPSD